MKLYLIENTLNGKKYVGQTVSYISKRWAEHNYSARQNCARHLSRAIRKYGRENFTVIELMPSVIPSQPLLDMFEKFFIKLLKTDNPEFGYNHTDGGKKYWKHSLETKEKIGKASAERKSRLGTKQSEEAKQKIAAAHRGTKRTPEQRLRMSVAAKKRGISEETHRKMMLTRMREKSCNDLG